METTKKAYDIKELGLKFKAKGLDLAEEALKMVVGETFDWLEESATISPNPYDDIVKVVIPVVKPKVMAVVDKVDGQEG